MTDGSLTVAGTADHPLATADGAARPHAGQAPIREPAAGAAGRAHGVAAPSGWPFLLPLGVLVAVFGLALLQPVLLLGGVAAMVIPIAGWFRDSNRELVAAQSGPHPAGDVGIDDPSRARSSFPGPALGLVAALVIVAVGVTLSLNVKGSTAAANGAGSGSVVSAVNGPAEVDAKNIQFSVKEIDAPANKSFTIEFKNEDSVPHNIAILDSSAGKKSYFRGKIVTGPASATYDVPAIPAGTYYFHCDVHPGMNGTVTVK